MFDPIGDKIKLLASVSLAFLLGLGLASGLEWTPGSQAAALSLPGTESSAVRLAAQQRAGTAAELGQAFIRTANVVTPAVVRIQAERTGAAPGEHALPPGFRDFFRQPGRGERPPVPRVAGGSGFIVSAEGYILTNNHVVEGADRIEVVLVDNRTFPAEIIGRDPTTDIAVIRIEAEDLPTARLGDSDRARVGEWVLAIGNPGFSGGDNTLDFTMTSGIISAKGRSLNIINRELYAEHPAAAGYAIEDFIQTDAVINPGNSGGPLVNLRGEVIGVNTAIASPTGFYQGYGFAIPINLVRRVMEDLVEVGHVRRARLGITIEDVSPEDAEVYDLPEISGVLVQDFGNDEASPAHDAGLKRHDVIVAVNGETVDRVGQLQRLIAQHGPGEVVEVGVIRYGTPHTFRIRLGAAPIPEMSASPLAGADGDDAPGDGGIGVEFADLNDALARELGFDDPGGAVVKVRPMSPAYREGVRSDWRVVSLNRQPITSAREAERVLRGSESGEVVSFLLQHRDGSTRIANVRVP